jgi:class 3 adenylate cyclase
LFADIVGFTTFASKTPATKVVEMLNKVFLEFDKLSEKYGVEKIKTIGDCYMAACGVPEFNQKHATEIAKMALDMKQIIKKNYPELDIRVGINSGKVVAGVIGSKKFVYDLWGDTVNIASRMESHSEPGKIQISENTYQYLKNNFNLEYRGEIEIKGKGLMKTWFLESVILV